MMRFIITLLFISVLVACGSTSKVDYSSRVDSNDFDSAGEAIRLEKLRVDQATPNRLIEFVFDEDESLVFICDYDNCERFKQNDGFSIHLNRDGSFSSFPRLIAPGALQICGIGDAYAIFEGYRLWSKLGLQRNRAYIGNKNWSKKYPEFCYHTFTKLADNMKYFEVSVADAISKDLVYAHVHIRESDPDALKSAVIRSKLDMLIKQVYAKDSRKLSEDYKVIEYKSNSLRQVLKKQVDVPISKNGIVDGILFFNNDINPIATPLTFKTGTDSDQMPDLLEGLYKSLGKQNVSSKEKSEVLIRFIPPKILKPAIPTIPKLQKGEFEKQSAFEVRAKNLIIKKEREIHKLVQDYNFEVFSRNEYVKALYRSYDEYLSKQSIIATKNQQAFIRNQDLVSRVVLQALYSDLTVSRMDYDSEAERLYISLVSARNGFNERVVVQLEPEIAKKIKLDNDYQLSLDLSVKNNNLSFSGVHVLHDEKRYAARFTETQFKPMRLVMESTAPIEIESTDSQSDFSDWLQKDKDLRNDINHMEFYLTLRKDYDLELPEWFMTPCADCVTSKGQSINEALSSARAELSRRKQVKVAASQTVSNEMFESAEGQSSMSRKYAEIVKTQSNSVLTRDEYTVTKQKEIDGSWYVELKFL
jgi:hypothetical protein